MHFAQQVRYGSLLMAMLIGASGRAAAQQSVAVEPRHGIAERDLREVLARRVTLNLDRVSLRTAIQAIADQAKVAIVYQVPLLDATGRVVTLSIVQRPLGAVLTELLEGTNLQLVVTGRDVVSLQPGSAISVQGSIIGVVTNAKTKQPMRSVSVTLDDSVKADRTNEAGQYRFANIQAGTHRISVRAIGFSRQTKLVTVAGEDVVKADFALEESVNALDQVVVTATGAQRYRELGHVVTQINADSLVREAPIATVSELLTARVPGLQVLGSNGGTVGGDVSLRLRGTTTTSLDPQPIVIVDGVRYKNTNSVPASDGSMRADTRPFNAELRSPLNDLNVNDIAAVEVVKGPSASTLYGPDAANGVIIITTKRGQASKPQWHVYAYPDLSTLSVGSPGSRLDPTIYQGWGHVPSTGEIFQGQCTLLLQARKLCALDSLVQVQDGRNNPETSMLAKQRPQWHSGASVSGGASTLAYFFSGNYDNQTGVLQLSPDAARVLEAQLGLQSLVKAIHDPNTQQTLSLHTNVSSAINPKANLTVVGNYVHATQQAVSVGVSGSIGAPLYEAGVIYTPSDSQTVRFYNGAAGFLSSTQMQVQRLTATLSGDFRPTTWLTANGSVGTDLDNTIDRGIQPKSAISNGEAHDDHRDNTNYNTHVGATATTRHESLSFRTSFGMDYSYVNLDGLSTVGSSLAPGSTDITTARTQNVTRLWSEVVQLGGYGEEVLGLRDQLYLTGALRIDGSTSFGDAYAPKPFPKVGASWVLSDAPWFSPLKNHGFDEIRVRYSFGAASRYPTSIMKEGRIRTLNATVEDVSNAIFQRVLGANPDLRPERSREAEYGADIDVGSTVRLGLTWYNRRTLDELQTVSGTSGLVPVWANVGDLSARGFEATLDVKVLQSQRTSLNLALSYANTTNKVLSIGSGVEYKSDAGSVVIGYPLSAAFSRKTIGFVDTARGGPDGIISQGNEVILSPQEYLGVLIAPRTYAVSPTLTFLSGQIRISTLVDGQAGGVAYNPRYECGYSAASCAGIFLKSTPLLDQAKFLGLATGDFITSSNFTRWRELSLTGDLPTAARHRLRLSRASASFQLRNLAIWTPSKAPDPESIPGLGSNSTAGSINGITGIPQPRSWTVRFDITP